MEQARFEDLWNRCREGAGGASATRAWEAVSGGYGEAHRRYHTPAHIDHCLGQFDLARGVIDSADAVEMAIWFHDVVYDSGAADNERRSADLFLELAGDGFSADFRSLIDELVMVTVHRNPPVTDAQCYVVDIDLSSFGLPWEEFVRDSVAVREEFPHLSDADYYPRQREFMESLLARPQFCFTDFFRARHQQRARTNIRRHLDVLRAQGLLA